MKKWKYQFPMEQRNLHQRITNTGLVFLTLALSGLSIKAQFYFWKGLFGMETAVVASSVFEILRLASLYTFLKWVGKKAIVGGILYLSLALFLGAVAITSWTAEIMQTQRQQESQYEKEIQTRIDSVKSVYARQINEKTSKLDRDIYYIESQIAKNPQSQSLIRRRIQLKDSRDELIRQREAFLSEIPENKEQWIAKTSPLVGIRFDPIEQQSTGLEAIESALMSTWRMNTETAKKVVAIVFVIAIELGIFLLAVMTERQKGDDEGVSEHDSIVTYLQKRFEEDEIMKFIEKSREVYNERGTLPKSSELAIRLRGIRRTIVGKGFKKNDIEMLLDQYSECSSK